MNKVTVVAGTGFTLLGFDQGVVSGLLTLPSFEAQFPETAGGFQGSKSATLQSFLVAICKSIRFTEAEILISSDELGCMAGAMCNLYVGDRLGRLNTIVL